MKTTVTRAGNIVTIRRSNATSHESTVLPITGKRYINKKTGEVKPMEAHAKSRADNVRNIRRSFSELRDCINANCRVDNCKFITLTYAENMTDHVKAVRDVKNFISRKIRKYRPDAQYIYALEPQARGAWHIHLLLIYEGAHEDYLPNSVVATWWRHGFTKTNNLDEMNNGKPVDNVGAYLSAYLMDLPGEDELGRPMTERKAHKIEKGARLALYPAGCHLWNRSKGLVKPDVSVYDDLADALHDNELLGVKPTYRAEKDFTTAEGYTIHCEYLQYNLDRIDSNLYKRYFDVA